MSQQALKTVATGTAVATPAKDQTLAGLLCDPKIKAQMALALPKHMTADRLARIALTEIRKVPKLAECDKKSFLGAIMQCASLGLEPGGALGHAYLLPFDKKRKNDHGKWVTDHTEAQLIIGYRGMIDLARRSGQILSLEARAVYAKDEFNVELGLASSITHRPAWGELDRGQLTFVYAVAKLKDGGVQFEVMSRAEIEVIRNGSQGYKSAVETAKRYNKEASSPWISNFEEMAKKTVIRRLFKYLPVSIELQRAVGLDEQADAGLSQDNALVIDGEYERVTPREEDEAAAQLTDEGALTAQEVHDAMVNAPDRDALDVAYDMVRMLPEAEREPLHALYQTRLDGFELDAK